MESALSPTQTHTGKAPRLSPSPPPREASSRDKLARRWFISRPALWRGWGQAGRARGQGAERFRRHPPANARTPGLTPVPPRALPRTWGPQGLLEGLRAARPQPQGPALPPLHVRASQGT